MRNTTIITLSLLSTLTLLLGCGSKGPAFVVQKKISPASGKFTIDGNPPSSPPNGELPHNIIIKLYPKGKSPNSSEIIKTRVAPDGKFAFSTYTQGDGAPVGSYIMCWESLTLVPFTNNIFVGPDRFKNNFSNPLSQDEKYSITITEQNKDNISIPPIDINTTNLIEMEPNQFSAPLSAEKAK